MSASLYEEKFLKEYLDTLTEKALMKKGDVLVLGCSTSEVSGTEIGKASSESVAEALLSFVLAYVKEKGFFLAVQCCEHLNRALVIENEALLLHRLEEVSVVPTWNAGGAAATVAFALMKEACVVEHIQAKAGVDIGDTEIAMHVKFVQVPFRHALKQIGQARLTAVYARPKLIGGARAIYEKSKKL